MWVFAYGSLLWNPGFEAEESIRAELKGYTRSFCMWSIHHRGTEEDPGLVLALDTASENAVCAGLALKAKEAEADTVLQMLRDRELISSAYTEEWLDITLSDGRTETAVSYVINRDHDQYCAHLNLEEQAQVIAKAVGGRGPNPEYLYNTADQLTQMGIPDPDMEWLTQRVRALTED